MASGGGADSAFDRFVAGLPADYFRSESEKDIARVAFAAGVTVGAFSVVADTARERESRAGGEAASGPDLSATPRSAFAIGGVVESCHPGIARVYSARHALPPSGGGIVHVPVVPFFTTEKYILGELDRLAKFGLLDGLYLKKNIKLLAADIRAERARLTDGVIR